MDTLKKLVAGLRVESDGAPLLSDIIAATNGYIPPAELQTILTYASDVQASDEPKSARQKAWITDFIQNIEAVMAADCELNNSGGCSSKIV